MWTSRHSLRTAPPIASWRSEPRAVTGLLPQSYGVTSYGGDQMWLGELPGTFQRLADATLGTPQAGWSITAADWLRGPIGTAAVSGLISLRRPRASGLTRTPRRRRLLSDFASLAAPILIRRTPIRRGAHFGSDRALHVGFLGAMEWIIPPLWRRACHGVQPAPPAAQRSALGTRYQSWRYERCDTSRRSNRQSSSFHNLASTAHPYGKCAVCRLLLRC